MEFSPAGSSWRLKPLTNDFCQGRRRRPDEVGMVLRSVSEAGSPFTKGV